jgi:hypothetical protein
MSEGAEVFDFIEYKLAKYIDELAAQGKVEDASQVLNIFELYITGAVHVVFRDGIPHYWYKDKAPATSEND